jgi:hypothetical protein
MERTYTLEEVSEIVDRATHSVSNDAFSEAEILRITAELGIPEGRVREAIREFDAQRPPEPGPEASLVAEDISAPGNVAEPRPENLTPLTFSQLLLGWLLFIVWYHVVDGYERATGQATPHVAATVTICAPFVFGILTALHPRFPRRALLAIALFTSIAPLLPQLLPTHMTPFNMLTTVGMFVFLAYGAFALSTSAVRVVIHRLQRSGHVTRS